MKLLCVILLLPQILPAQVDISEARKMRSGKVVTVNGQVIATFGDLSFIEDRSGAIAVYGASTNENDSISVTGKLSKFNGLLEIVVDSMKVLKASLKPVTPKVVTRITDHEAELVQLQNVSLQPQGHFFYPSRSGILIKNNDTTQYWIDENTDLPGYLIPATSTITGIVSRYGSQFQLLPRSHTDIENITPEQRQTDSNFKVLNWNLEFFGAPKYGPSNDNLQLTNVARVLNSTHADLMALQEISNDDTFKSLVQLMPGYNGRCSNRYSYSFDPSGDFPPQKLCFIYNTQTVKVIRDKILFSKYFDDNPSDIFSSGRLPYLLEVEALGHRLYFVNIHAKSGYDDDARNRRIIDATMLKDTLDHYYSNKNVFILGDFNDVLEGSYENFIDDLKYDCISRSLNENGWHSTISYDDVIDQQVILSALSDNFINVGIVNPFQLAPLYEKTTSDHLPVMSEFDLTKIVTGITDDELNVYPNPASNEIWFTPANSSVTLMNSIGAVLYKNKNTHPPISLNGYAPGIYYVILRDRVFKIVRN
ncbi:MAG: endonuclease/exonuclease/phosphatase family protein [Bacteroidota bacterium]